MYLAAYLENTAEVRVLTQLINIIDVHESFGELVDRTKDVYSRTESRRR
jgi:hypothetical protein